MHEVMGRKRENILFQKRQNAFDNGDSDEDEPSEGEGVGTYSDEDEDEEDLDKPKTQALPKSASGKVKTMRGRNERVMPPEECRAILRRLFENEKAFCSLMFGRHGAHSMPNEDRIHFASADIFFLDCLLVTPTRFRPPAKMGETLFEHPQNEMLSKVLVTTYSLRDQNEELRRAQEKDSGVEEPMQRRLLGRLLETLIQLQVDVNSFMDSSKNPTKMGQGKLPPAGVKQTLEKKEGLFRMHMMVCILPLFQVRH